MWWQWLIFALIIIAIPYGLYNIKKSAFKRVKPTKEQETKGNQRFFVLCLFYWLCDFFYMTFIINNLTWRFILGGLIMVIVFYNLSKAFIGGSKVFNFGLIQDFIVGIALTVYLIYIIPNKELQDIIIPIIAAVYGGLLTLVGVAWTIKKSDNDRKQAEEQRVKPLVFICNPQTISINKEELMKGILLSKRNIGSLKTAEANKVAFILPQIVISNSDYSHVAIRGFRINDEYHLYDHGQVLPKNKTFYLQNDFRFEYSNEIEYVAILLQDMLENLYELELNFSINKEDKNKTIIINSGIETRRTTLAINPKEI